MIFLPSLIYSQAPEPTLHIGMASQQRDQPTPISGGQGIVLLLFLRGDY